jgi:hypothetical protein
VQTVGAPLKENADRQNLNRRSEMHAPSNILAQDAPAIRVVSGRKLAHELKGASAAAAALASADAQTGRLVITPLPPRWANRMFGANPRLSKAARELVPLERAAVRRGQLDLTRPVSDAAIDKVVAKLGPDRVLAALDRITKPVVMAAPQ